MGAKVRELRSAQGISQRQLALMTGISRSYLWKIETGTADIGIDVLIKIARALDAQVRELIEF
ncbi:helix-turn-helix domain-containing protein [Enorma phocaeensis]|uniref:helix-turn-helix domain-containing protein n=1 Tax=Enorma phocaeensis TaxID=1871019 RepID=UPI00320B9BDF